MSDVHDVRELLAAFRERPVPAEDAATREARRARVVGALRPLVEAGPSRRAAARRRRVGWLVGGAVAAAAALTLVIVGAGGLPADGRGAGSSEGRAVAGPTWTVRSLSGAARVAGAATPEQKVPLVSGSEAGLAAGSVMSTTRESARVGAGCAAQSGDHCDVDLELAPHTQLAFEELSAGSRRVRLQSGAAVFDVSPLTQGTRRGTFTVVTADATVVVHGTRFLVEAPTGPADSTCVRVTEGVVVVHAAKNTARLTAGGTFGCRLADTSGEGGRANHVVGHPGSSAGGAAPAPSPGVPPEPPVDEEAAAAPRPPAASQQPPPAPAPAAAPADQATAPSGPSSEPSQAPASQLVEQNRLLREALAAERRGDKARAASLLRQLLRRHPSSPLAPVARSALARVTAAR